MNFKHLSLGLLLIIIGLILAPTLTPEDLITSVPLIAILGAETYAIVAVIGYLCIIAGVFLAGFSSLRHFGFFGRMVASHRWAFVIGVLLLCVIIIWFVTEG